MKHHSRVLLSLLALAVAGIALLSVPTRLIEQAWLRNAGGGTIELGGPCLRLGWPWEIVSKDSQMAVVSVKTGGRWLSAQTPETLSGLLAHLSAC